MPKPKYFMTRDVLKEFNSITHVFMIMFTSIFIISGSLYALFVFSKTLPQIILFSILLLIGLLVYLLSEAGRDLVKVLSRKGTPSKNVGLNVHLGFAWFMAFITIFLPLFTFNNVKFLSTGFNPSAFVAVATAIIIADSIFAILVTVQLSKLKKRIATVLQFLIMSIALPIISLMLIALGVIPSVVFVFISLSIFSMYSFFGIFLYYVKKFGVAGI